jgi:hypothetical protein
LCYKQNSRFIGDKTNADKEHQDREAENQAHAGHAYHTPDPNEIYNDTEPGMSESELPTSPENLPGMSESATWPCRSDLVRSPRLRCYTPTSPYLADVAGPDNQPGTSEWRHPSAYAMKERFDRAIQGFTEAYHISYKSLETLWAPKNGLFGGAGAQDGLQRFHRLTQGRENIIPYSAMFELIDRLTVLFVTYEIGCLLGTKAKPDPSSSKHDIFHELAQRSGKSIEYLDFNYRRGLVYYDIIKHTGPGTVVQMGRNVQSL